jgi:hypothetical protein
MSLLSNTDVVVTRITCERVNPNIKRLFRILRDPNCGTLRGTNILNLDPFSDQPDTGRWQWPEGDGKVGDYELAMTRVKEGGDADTVHAEHAVDMFHLRCGRIAGSLAAALPRWELTVIPGTAHSSTQGLLQGRMT